MIEIKNLSKSYKVGDQKVDALKDINLKIKKGEFLVIVGPSGSGKSTLMHLLSGLDKPTAGSVFANGKKLSKMKDKQLSRFRNKKIGYIFQDFKLHPHLSIVDNVKIPLIFNKEKTHTKATMEKKAKNLLKQVGIAERSNHKPDEISGGQKQRAAIARALINSPTLILADEPMGDLDTVTGNKIIKLLKQFHESKKVTMIVVTHDLSISKYASRIIEIKDGILITKNKFKKFLN